MSPQLLPESLPGERGVQNESGLDFNPGLRPQDKLDLFGFLPIRKSGRKSLAVHGGIQGPNQQEGRPRGAGRRGRSHGWPPACCGGCERARNPSFSRPREVTDTGWLMGPWVHLLIHFRTPCCQRSMADNCNIRTLHSASHTSQAMFSPACWLTGDGEGDM